MYICVKKLQKWVVDMILSHKNTQLKKKNCLKQSLGSKDINILKYAIFRVFSMDGHTIFLIFVASGDEFVTPLTTQYGTCYCK
jgi:hypothetical protein